MLRRGNGWMYAIVFFIALGLLSQLATNPSGLILPLLIFGVIFYLYKFPPNWLLRSVGHPHAPSGTQRAQRKKARAAILEQKRKQRARRKRLKKAPLKVIDGKKKDWPPRRKSQ